MAPKRKESTKPAKASPAKKSKQDQPAKKSQKAEPEQKQTKKASKKDTDSLQGSEAKGKKTERTVASSAKPHSEEPRTKTASDSPKEPPAAFAIKGTTLVNSSVDLAEGRRNKDGFLTFDGFPEFKPNLTPKQVIQAGSFGGIYFNPRGGKPGHKWGTKGVPIDHREFPEDWFQGLHPDYYIARRYIAKRNKYMVKAGQDQAGWEEHGWIKDQDPRGWFHWYCRFYQGRRTDDDERQIGRWKGVCGEKGRWKRSLVNKCLSSGKAWNDSKVSPVVRQSLLHWGYELTQKHFEKMAKAVQS